jgi:parallel beta-helix repeat protein
MIQSASANELHVNSQTGNDRATGDSSAPFQTITYALQQARPGTIIRLAEGTYQAATKENFPLLIPQQVTLIGNEATNGQNILIQGSGLYRSSTFAQQNVTIVLSEQSALRGVTITNPVERGTGAWIESTNPAIANNTFINCKREGIFVSGTARPLILHNVLQNNAASGIFFARNAKGEVRNNRCQQTGYGIAVSDEAAPLLINNQLIDNRAGIVLSRSARPILRDNRIERNINDGLVILNQAVADLGDRQDPGNNYFIENGQWDLRNESSLPLQSVGNQLNPVRVQGVVTFLASQLPIVPPIRQASPIPSPVPSPAPVPTPPVPAPIPTPDPDSSKFSDVEGYWAQPFLEGLVERNIIRGFPDQTFRPTARLTRAQYAAMLSQAFDLPLKQTGRNFWDVPANFWAADAIRRAERMGFIAGFPDGSFRPNDNLTRVQAIISLVNGLGLTGGAPTVLNLYRDRAQIPTYAIQPVATATQKRMVVNYPRLDTLEPLTDITRAEISAILYQALVITGQAPAISSRFIVDPGLSNVSFSDVQGHWAVNFIEGLTPYGIVTGFGDNTFRPETAMSRAQYAVLLANTFNPLPKRAQQSFIDVPKHHWAFAAIQQVNRGGLLSGFGDGTFQPQQDIWRLHVLISLVIALELPEGDDSYLTRYDDAHLIPSYARGAIASATQHGIVVNYPNPQYLSPNRGATRAEVIAMLYQALTVAGRMQPLASPYIVVT